MLGRRTTSGLVVATASLGLLIGVMIHGCDGVGGGSDWWPMVEGDTWQFTIEDEDLSPEEEMQLEVTSSGDGWEITIHCGECGFGGDGDWRANGVFAAGVPQLQEITELDLDDDPGDPDPLNLSSSLDVPLYPDPVVEGGEVRLTPLVEVREYGEFEEERSVDLVLEVVSVGEAIDVPAGSFDNVARVEVRADGALVAEVALARDHGPVLVEFTAEETVWLAK